MHDRACGGVRGALAPCRPPNPRARSSSLPTSDTVAIPAIHAFDDPIQAPLALTAAKAYAEIAPAVSHAVHMPTHIFIQHGMWNEVAYQNVRAFDVANDIWEPGDVPATCPIQAIGGNTASSRSAITRARAGGSKCSSKWRRSRSTRAPATRWRSSRRATSSRPKSGRCSPPPTTRQKKRCLPTVSAS